MVHELLEPLPIDCDEAIYLISSSAIVKLVVTEPETTALRKYLRTRPDRVTSELSVAEVMRAALRRDAELVETARRLLARVDPSHSAADWLREPVVDAA